MDNSILNERKIDYIRNMESGLTESVLKNKDINREIIGQADIQIFNEDGSLALEANTQNLINNQSIWNTVYLGFLNMGALGANTTLGTAFGKLFLTNTNAVESELHEEILGEVIGHADVRLPYSLDNAYQGSVLPEHSSITPGQFKFSVSFGANTANGSFTDIWFGASSPVHDSIYNSSNGLGYSIRKAELIDGTWDNNNSGLCSDDNGKLYNFTTTSVTQFELLEKGFRKALIKGATTSIVNDTGSTIQTAVFSRVTREFYVAYSDYTKGIGIYDESFNFVGSIPYSTSGIVTLGFAGDKILLVDAFRNTYSLIDPLTKQFVILDATTNVTAKPLYIPGGHQLYRVTTNWDGTRLHYQTSSSPSSPTYIEHVFRIEADGTIVYEPICVNETSDISRKFPLSNQFGKNYYGGIDSYIYKSYCEPGTQTKLAGVVTKVQGQTMKITYSFNFQ